MFFFYSREGNVRDGSNSKTSNITLINTASSENLSEWNKQTAGPHQYTTAFTNIHQDITNNCNEENLLLLEEFMDFLPFTLDMDQSTSRKHDDNTRTVRRSYSDLIFPIYFSRGIIGIPTLRPIQLVPITFRPITFRLLKIRPNFISSQFHFVPLQFVPISFRPLTIPPNFILFQIMSIHFYYNNIK